MHRRLDVTAASPGQTNSEQGRRAPDTFLFIVMINEPRGLSKVDFSLSAAFWVNRSLTTWWDLPSPTPAVR